LTELSWLYLEYNQLDNSDLPYLYNLDSLDSYGYNKLNLSNNPGITSGTAMQTLGDNLDKYTCRSIKWDGTCGIDPNLAAIAYAYPDSATTGQAITVEATATDTNQANVQMKIDWDNGTISTYTELRANATTFEFTHLYGAAGDYEIKVIARNKNGVTTDWSNSRTINVQGESINIVHFNDPRLEQAVRDALGKPTGGIMGVDMVNLITFEASDRKISDLSGLEYAINLTHLNLEQNQISAISALQNFCSMSPPWLLDVSRLGQ
jgi:hypothetical protein